MGDFFYYGQKDLIRQLETSHVFRHARARIARRDEVCGSICERPIVRANFFLSF